MLIYTAAFRTVIVLLLTSVDLAQELQQGREDMSLKLEV